MKKKGQLRSQLHGDVEHPKSYRHLGKHIKEQLLTLSPSFVAKGYYGSRIFQTHRDNDGMYRGCGGCDGGSFIKSIRVPKLSASNRVWRNFKKLFPFLYEDDNEGNPVSRHVEIIDGKRYLKTFAMNHDVGHTEVLIGAWRIKPTITRTKRFILKEV